MILRCSRASCLSFLMLCIIFANLIVAVAEPSRPQRLPVENVIDLIVNYLDSKELDFKSGLNYSLITSSANNRSSYARYLFVWAKRINNVTLPDYIYVAFDPYSQKIIKSERIKENVTISITPHVNKTFAELIATNASSYTPISITSELVVTSAFGQQRLVYYVDVIGQSTNSSIRRALYAIDAHSGEIIYTDYYR